MYDILIKNGTVIDGSGAAGSAADICVFDPEAIVDKATYTEVSHPTEGLHWVVVGGKVAAQDATLSGKVLPRQ